MKTVWPPFLFEGKMTELFLLSFLVFLGAGLLTIVNSMGLLTAAEFSLFTAAVWLAAGLVTVVKLKDWAEDQMYMMGFPTKQLVLLSILVVIGALFATETVIVEVWLEKLLSLLGESQKVDSAQTVAVMVAALHMLLVLVVEEESLGTPMADIIDLVLDGLVMAFWQQIWWCLLDPGASWLRLVRLFGLWLRLAAWLVIAAGVSELFRLHEVHYCTPRFQSRAVVENRALCPRDGLPVPTDSPTDLGSEDWEEEEEEIELLDFEPPPCS